MLERKGFTLPSVSSLIQGVQPDISGGPQHPFLQDLASFHQENKHYSKEIVYDTTDIDTMVYEMIQKKETFQPGDSLKGNASTEVCGSNAQEMVAARLEEDLNWSGLVKKMIRPHHDFTFSTFLGFQEHDDILLKGELTAPLVEAVEEKGEEDETNWHCKGCSKYFATKASLKRHHDRKKSCKDFVEKTENPATVQAESSALPDKPYIIDWADQILIKSISGDSEKPYCKHCDVEFANKSNLNKHLSKSVACDRLAKQEFVSLVKQLA